MPFQEGHSRLSPKSVFLYQPHSGFRYKDPRSNADDQQQAGNLPLFIILLQGLVNRFTKTIKKKAAPGETYGQTADDQRQPTLVKNFPIKYPGSMEQQISCTQSHDCCQNCCQKYDQQYKTKP